MAAGGRCGRKPRLVRERRRLGTQEVRGPREARPLEGRWEWLGSTRAALPSAVLAALCGLPQNFCRQYGDYDPRIPEWFDCMFLRGKPNELKEHFVAMSILMYISSLAYRYWTLRKNSRDVNIEA